MSHSIQVIIGKKELIDKINANLFNSSRLILNQNIAIIPLTNKLYDQISNEDDFDTKEVYEGFIYLNSSIENYLKKLSINGLIGYIETEYFGGTGTQSAILYGDKEIKIGPLITETKWDSNLETYKIKPKGRRAINLVLKELGVVKEINKFDEFESIGLNELRSNERIIKKCL